MKKNKINLSLNLFEENDNVEFYNVAEVFVGKSIPIRKHGEEDYLADWGQADASQSIDVAQLVKRGLDLQYSLDNSTIDVDENLRISENSAQKGCLIRSRMKLDADYISVVQEILSRLVSGTNVDPTEDIDNTSKLSQIRELVRHYLANHKQKKIKQPIHFRCGEAKFELAGAIASLPAEPIPSQTFVVVGAVDTIAVGSRQVVVLSKPKGATKLYFDIEKHYKDLSKAQSGGVFSNELYKLTYQRKDSGNSKPINELTGIELINPTLPGIENQSANSDFFDDAA